MRILWAAVLVFLASPAWAQCTSPAGQAGTIDTPLTVAEETRERRLNGLGVDLKAELFREQLGAELHQVHDRASSLGPQPAAA